MDGWTDHKSFWTDLERWGNPQNPTTLLYSYIKSEHTHTYMIVKFIFVSLVSLFLSISYGQAFAIPKKPKKNSVEVVTTTKKEVRKLEQKLVQKQQDLERALNGEDDLDVLLKDAYLDGYRKKKMKMQEGSVREKKEERKNSQEDVVGNVLNQIGEFVNKLRQNENEKLKMSEDAKNQKEKEIQSLQNEIQEIEQQLMEQNGMISQMDGRWTLAKDKLQSDQSSAQSDVQLLIKEYENNAIVIRDNMKKLEAERESLLAEKEELLEERLSREEEAELAVNALKANMDAYEGSKLELVMQLEEQKIKLQEVELSLANIESESLVECETLTQRVEDTKQLMIDIEREFEEEKDRVAINVERLKEEIAEMERVRLFKARILQERVDEREQGYYKQLKRVEEDAVKDRKRLATRIGKRIQEKLDIFNVKKNEVVDAEKRLSETMAMVQEKQAKYDELIEEKRQKVLDIKQMIQNEKDRLLEDEMNAKNYIASKKESAIKLFEVELLKQEQSLDIVLQENKIELQERRGDIDIAIKRMNVDFENMKNELSAQLNVLKNEKDNQRKVLSKKHIDDLALLYEKIVALEKEFRLSTNQAELLSEDVRVSRDWTNAGLEEQNQKRVLFSADAAQKQKTIDSLQDDLSRKENQLKREKASFRAMGRLAFRMARDRFRIKFLK